MRRAQRDLLAIELLVAALGPGRPRTARVDHHARAELAAVGQVQRGRVAVADRSPFPEQRVAAGLQHGAHHLAQARARDHVVGGFQYPSIAGEAHS